MAVLVGSQRARIGCVAVVSHGPLYDMIVILLAHTEAAEPFGWRVKVTSCEKRLR